MKKTKVNYSYAFYTGQGKDNHRGSFWGLVPGVRYRITGVGIDEDDEQMITLREAGAVRFKSKHFKTKIIINKRGINNEKNSEEKGCKKSSKKSSKKKRSNKESGKKSSKKSCEESSKEKRKSSKRKTSKKRKS